MNVRIRRLQSDYDAMKVLCRKHPRVEIEGVSGSPPERYRLVLKVRSLRKRGEEIETADAHRVELVLPGTYPRDPPFCRMLTPVFHPNIDPQTICVGDHWTAAESLATLVQRIGEMLAFQSYNVKSPRNGDAARWVEENVDRLPVDRIPFFIDLDSLPSAAAAPAPASGTCGNCGSATDDAERCDKGHRLCPDCSVHCPTCGALLCLACGVRKCPACTPVPCANCGGAGHAATCERGHRLCPDCAMNCPGCGRVLCLACGVVRCPDCG
jgi:ubiquitin-protein ligase